MQSFFKKSKSRCLRRRDIQSPKIRGQLATRHGTYKEAWRQTVQIRSQEEDPLLYQAREDTDDHAQSQQGSAAVAGSRGRGE